MAFNEINFKLLLHVLVAILLASSIATAQSDASGPAPTGTTRFAQYIPPTARAIFERAVKMRKAGKLQVAMTLMEEAIKMFPDYFEARYALAIDLARTGNPKAAIAQLERARKINPADDRVFQSFGAILIEQKQYPLAAAAFTEAARLNPTNPRYHLMRAVAILYYIAEIDAAPKQSVEDRSYLLGRAEESLNQAYLLSAKKLTIVHFYLGMLYDRKGEPLRAADALEQYLRDNPQADNAAMIRETIEKLRQGNVRSQQ